MAVTVKLEGFEELATKLRALAPAMRKRVLRNALAAGARIVRDDAKRAAPVLKAENRTPFRKAGTVRDAIKVRTSKADRKDGNVGVFVNVAPAKGAKYRKGQKVRDSARGAQSRDDPFYWRWLEFGRKARAGTPASKGVIRGRKARRAVGAIAPMRFLQGAAKRLPEALRIFQTQVGAWIDRVNRSGKVDP